MRNFLDAQHRATALLIDVNQLCKAGNRRVDNFITQQHGKWFIAVRPSSEQALARELRLTLNWFEELKRLVPTGAK